MNSGVGTLLTNEKWNFEAKAVLREKCNKTLLVAPQSGAYVLLQARNQLR
jgi:hypothetical protein